MTRKMASIQRIKAIRPIPGADQIEVATVQGWDVVVKKNEFKEGQMAVYFEIDSWVPNTIAPFLTKEGSEPKVYNGVKGERLKTIRLRKQLSQGLLLATESVAQIKGGVPTGLNEGDDVTEIIGVQKWESPEEKAVTNGGTATGAKNRPFPYYIRKTDQERIQNIAHMVEAALFEEFEVTLKKDGSSLTVFKVMPNSPYYKDAKARDNKELTLWQRFTGMFRKAPVYGICSRNLQLKLEGNTNFHKGADKILKGLRDYEGSVAIQAELVAPNIQGNYEKVQEVEVHCFDVFDIDKQQYFLPRDRKLLCRQLDIPHVTVLAQGRLIDVISAEYGDDIVAKCLAYAEGPGDNIGVKREGIVAKAMERDFSFKAVATSYLLATGK